jgi:cytochrome c biogenesis protein CcdA
MTPLRAYVVGGMNLSLLLIGLVGGVITGLSPCILPVLPVIFLSGGAHRRPYLVVTGLVTSFSLLTLAGAAILTALPIPPSAIRWAGLIALVLLGVGLIVPRVEALLEAPFKAVAKYGIKYPVAVDNDYATWASFGVQAWPSMFLIDPNGTVRHISIGEGGYDETEGLIRSLLPAMASQ